MEMEIDICQYCSYRNSWDCGDGYNRRKNCDSFMLDWDMLSSGQKDYIKQFLERGY